MLISSALIGYGYWGPNIARAINKVSGVNLSFICDSSSAILQKAKLDYPQIQTTDNPQDVLNNPSIDAIIIATPAKSHFELATQALKSGKHVLIEKPLTTSVEQANALKELNRKNKKIVMVGHTFEFNPSVKKMKQIMKEKTFGQTYYIYSTRVNLGQVRGDINALWNLAPHDISIINFLLESQPVEVMATGAGFLNESIEDVVFVMLRYPNNVFAKIHVSWLDPAKERKMVVVGSKKMLVFDDLDNEMPIKIYDKRVDTVEAAKGLPATHKVRLHSGDIYIPQIENKEPLLEEIKHFFECIEKNKLPITDLVNGLNVVKVLEACQTSLKENNQWIKV